MRNSTLLLCSLTMLSCSDIGHKTKDDSARKTNSQPIRGLEDYISQETETVMVGSVCEIKVNLVSEKPVGDNIAKVEYVLGFFDPGDETPMRKTDITFTNGTSVHLSNYVGNEPDIVAVNDIFFGRLSSTAQELFAFVDTHLRVALIRYRVDEDALKHSCDWTQAAKYKLDQREAAVQALSTLRKLIPAKPEHKNAH